MQIKNDTLRSQDNDIDLPRWLKIRKGIDVQVHTVFSKHIYKG